MACQRAWIRRPWEHASSCRSARVGSQASSWSTNSRGSPALEGIKPIREALDRTAFVPADVTALARWTAEYYAGGVGEAITAVLPPKTRGVRADAHKSRRVVTLTAAGAEALAAPAGASGPTRKQREALAILAGAPDGVATADLAARGFSADLVGRLVRDGALALHRQQVDRDPFEVTGKTWSGKVNR